MFGLSCLRWHAPHPTAMIYQVCHAQAVSLSMLTVVRLAFYDSSLVGRAKVVRYAMLRAAKHVRYPSPRLAVASSSTGDAHAGRDDHLLRTPVVHYHAPYQSSKSCEVCHATRSEACALPFAAVGGFLAPVGRRTHNAPSAYCAPHWCIIMHPTCEKVVRCALATPQAKHVRYLSPPLAVPLLLRSGITTFIVQPLTLRTPMVHYHAPY